MELARIVVEAQQQRPDVSAGPVLMPSKTGHDTIGCAGVLDLGHCALAGLVGSGERLGNDAVQPGALETIEPVARHLNVLDCGREMDRRLRLAQLPFDALSTLALRELTQILVSERQ